MFELVFRASLHQFTSDLALVQRLWSDIEVHYSSSGRYYHNLYHLDHLIFELQQVKNGITD